MERAEQALFAPEQSVPGAFDLAHRHGLARAVASWLGSPVLTEHHDHLAAPDPGPGWDAALTLAQMQTLTPALVEAGDLDAVAQYWNPDEIVVISQVVAFTAFRARYLAGIDLLSGREPRVSAPAPADPISAGRSKSTATRTGNGLPRPVHYTRDLLSWTPWVPPVAPEDLTEEQRDAFAGKTNGQYFRLLARLPRLLKARTQTDLAIFYTRQGLPRAERELAAAVVSKINDCIYCASVHARKAAQMAKRADDVDRLLAVDLPRDSWWRPTDLRPLSLEQDQRWAAVISFAADLTAAPQTLTPQALEPLRALGADDLDLVDLVGSVAFFSWANRLMLTLGEPFVPESKA